MSDDLAAGGWMSPKLVAQQHPRKGGRGVFATGSIQRGEVVAVWGGDVVTGEQLAGLNQTAPRYSVQVEDDLYLVTTRHDDPADYINHSCDPNLGVSGQIALVAMRDIEPGEEVCFDYAMTDGSPYDEFECACGSPDCRGRVTGQDWATPQLWQKYEGYFLSYLQRRIDRLRTERATKNKGAQ